MRHALIKPRLEYYNFSNMITIDFVRLHAIKGIDDSPSTIFFFLRKNTTS